MLTLTPITSLKDAMKARQIRNVCREYMTRNTNKISIIQQLKWWSAYQHQSSQQCYLLRDKGKPIGNGLVIEDDGKSWLSGGLLPETRGKGYGSRLFQFLIDDVKTKPIFLEVRKSNEAAHILYQKLGFKKVSEKDGIITMRWK